MIFFNKQLDFDDVLIKPRLSFLNHRENVSPKKGMFARKNSFLFGTPIMSANMTQTGTFEVAKELLENGCFASIHKFYTSEEIINFIKNDLGYTYKCDNLFITIGIRDFEKEINKLKEINKAFPLCDWKILIDVPNAYISNVKKCVEFCKKEFPNKVIAIGNVCTASGVRNLIKAGADIIKVGIGPSCFTGYMKIQTDKGLKKIKDIELGDKVLTHKGNYKEVINKFEFSDNNEFIKINNIECTPNHEFYVCNKSDIDKINENNYQEYCFWKEAKDLNDEYMILKIID